MLYRFKTLLLNKKHIYISLALIMFLLMPLIVFIGKLGGFLWYEDIQVFSVLYQFTKLLNKSLSCNNNLFRCAYHLILFI